MQLKHSKFKNTGILFELLVRRITADTLSGNHVTSPAVGILKKYFVNTELGKEYKLYDTIIKSNSLTESKANVIVCHHYNDYKEYINILKDKQLNHIKCIAWVPHSAEASIFKPKPEIEKKI